MAKFSDLDKILQSFAEKTVPGCGCMVAKNGKVLYEGYYGKADLETGRPVTANTVYRLFSMTKIIICTAAMIEWERGKFLLNEPYYNYFPEYEHTQVAETLPNGEVIIRPAKRPMLVRDAFNMSVGLPYPRGDSYTERKLRELGEQLSKKGKYTLQDDVRAMGSVPVCYDPGTHWSYGVGHELVAALVEKVSGKTIGEFLQQEIFDPLGMKDTGYRYFGDIRERMIQLYRPEENGTFTLLHHELDKNFEPDAIYEGGGVGLFGTVSDYSAFAQMMANGGQGILGRKTIDLMRLNLLNEQQQKDFKNAEKKAYREGYGYGLGVRTMLNPAGVANASVGEFGWSGMAGTWVCIDPAEKFSVVYMHQTIPNQQYYHHHRIRAAAYGCLE